MRISETHVQDRKKTGNARSADTLKYRCPPAGWWVCLLAVCLLIATPAMAEEPVEQTTSVSAKEWSKEEVLSKTDEELAENGWETRANGDMNGSVKDGLLAILVSPFWRGFGHWRTGDDNSHYKLLAMEGVSALMIGSAFLIGALSDDSKYLSPLWKTLFHLGITLYAASYLFDLIGTFKGHAQPINANQTDPYGLSMDLKFRYELANQFNLGAQIGLTYRNERFWANPYAYLGIDRSHNSASIIELNNWNAGVDMGVALWKDELPRTYLALAIDAKFQQFRADQYFLIKLIPYIEFSLDLGSWFEHLANIRFINRVGAGVELYQFNDLAAFTEHETLLILETELNLNLFKDFNFSVIYRQRPDFAIGTVTAPYKVANTLPVPGVGIFSFDLNFRVTESWQLEVDFNVGHAMDLWFSIMHVF